MFTVNTNLIFLQNIGFIFYSFSTLFYVLCAMISDKKIQNNYAINMQYEIM